LKGSDQLREGGIKESSALLEWSDGLPTQESALLKMRVSTGVVATRKSHVGLPACSNAPTL